MVEKHGVDESIDAIVAVDEPNKRARHGEGGQDDITNHGGNVMKIESLMTDIQTERPRIGSLMLDDWPNDTEERTPIDIDLNGDPEENEAKVLEILRNGSRRRREEENPSSIGSTTMLRSTSQSSSAPPDRVRRSHAGTPVGSTPPPPIRRSRRSAMNREPIAELVELEEESNVNNKATTTDTTIESIEVDTSHLFGQDFRSALPFLTKLVKHSASIPGFLKQEVVRLLHSEDVMDSRDPSGSGSDTQEDDYLKTKSKWIFELGRIQDDKIVTAREMDESNEDLSMAILTIQPHEVGSLEEKCIFERIDSQILNQTRSDIRTNPWFNAQGQPFSVIYTLALQNSIDSSTMSGGSGHITLATQNHSSQDQSVHQQQEIEELRSQNERLKKELEVASEDNASSKEQATLLKQLYDDASRSIMEGEIELDRLREENEKLQTQLNEGLTSIRSFSTHRLTELEWQLKQSNEQVELLKEQNRLTNDLVRKKAALWDAAEAREQERQEEIAQRQAKREKERRALQEQLLGTNGAAAAMVRKLPHEILLEVDLEKEKIDVEKIAEGKVKEDFDVDIKNGLVQNDDDEDELAALQREAAQYGAIDILADDDHQQGGTRARRSRRNRQSPTILPTINTNGNGTVQVNDEELAETMNQNQNQAMLAASNELEDQFGFVDQMKTGEGATPPL